MGGLWRLRGYLRPYLGSVFAGAVLVAIGGALMAGFVSTIRPLVNRLFLPGGPSAQSPSSRLLPAGVAEALEGQAALVAIPLLMIVIFLLRGICLYFGQYLTIRAGAKVIRDLRRGLFQSVTYQSPDFFQAHPTGTILARILNDVERLQRVCTRLLTDLIRVGTMVPFLLLTAIYHDWRISIVAFVALPLLAYPTVRLGRRLRRASFASQENMALMANRLTEAIAGVRVVQGFGMERYELQRFRDATDRMLAADLRAGRASALSPAVMELLGATIGGALFLFAGLQIQRGQTDPGSFAVVLFALGLLFTSMRRLNTVYSELQRARAAADRVFDLIDHQRGIRDAPAAAELPEFRHSIRLIDLSFSYGDRPVLQRVNLEVQQGEVIALVGPSGSGKSTLAALLPRFYDPAQGRIEIDGHDLRQVTLQSLRRQIATVTQETILFDDTVANNIAYGRNDISQSSIERAARTAHAHEFIVQLPQGYQTRLGERGARLSMGQRQRLTIARAILKAPTILILDEATSALDAESEALVQQALEALMRGRTSLVIAHRLATVRRADRIVVMEQGRIVEQGTHAELLGRDGAYSRLHRLQFAESA